MLSGMLPIPLSGYVPNAFAEWGGENFGGGVSAKKVRRGGAVGDGGIVYIPPP